MLQHEPEMKKYDLRWRFDYANRPSVWGKWSHPGNTPELMAYNKNKEGLVRASIEGQCSKTQTVKTMLECDGWDFINFQWIAVAMTPAGSVGITKPRHALVGMKLLTRDFEMAVMSNGDVAKRQRTDEEKQMNFATFGR